MSAAQASNVDDTHRTREFGVCYGFTMSLTFLKKRQCTVITKISVLLGDAEPGDSHTPATNQKEGLLLPLGNETHGALHWICIPLSLSSAEGCHGYPFSLSSFYLHCLHLSLFPSGPSSCFLPSLSQGLSKTREWLEL